MRGDRIRTSCGAGGAARLALLLSAAVFLAACPELETPLARVTGRIVGASPGAFVYPLGRPDLKVPVAADGTWVLEAVPTSVSALVLFDGAPFPVGRAERVAVDVEGGEINRVADRFGGGAAVDEALRMPLAGELVATVTVDGGATVAGPSLTVPETEHQALVPPSGAQLTIYPLPAGAWELSASLPGFDTSQAEVLALPGVAVDVTLTLEIDVDAPEPGCAALPGCDGGLACNASDGRCYSALP